MHSLLCQIMHNDSLREVFSRKYPYEDDLHRLSPDKDPVNLPVPQQNPDLDLSWLDDIARWLASVPSLVWILIGVVAAALLFVWAYRSGLFTNIAKEELPVGDEVNIYDVDFDHELADALSAANYAAALRIIYLRTLRWLADGGKVTWRIYKTPTQFAREANMAPFYRMTEQFLRIRYGKFEASEALYRKMVEWSGEVEKGGDV